MAPGANLRLADAADLATYVARTRQFISLGNSGFANLIDEDVPTPLGPHFETSHVLYHSWLPGLIEIDAEDAAIARRLMVRAPETERQAEFVSKLAPTGWLDPAPPDLSSLVRKTRDMFIAIQNASELELFLREAARLRPRTIVEIGTARGGLLYALAQLAAPAATLISIDLPGGPYGGGQTPEERRLYRTFAGRGQRIECVPQDSHAPETYRLVRELLGPYPIDLLFIDGDHSYDGVARDFAMYGELVRRDGLIAFHDICLHAEEWGERNAVGDFWQDLKQQYATREIIDATGVTTAHLPAGAHWAWGIGLISKH